MRKQPHKLRASGYLSAVSDIVRSEYENFLPQSGHTSYVYPEIVNGRLASGISCS
jgi:hypothetical protein